MIKRVMFAGALIAIAQTAAHAEVNAFGNAGDLVDAYNRGGDILLLRMYVRGITDGLGFANAELEYRHQPHLFCPPSNLGIVDAQHVAIMKSYLTKFPTLKSAPPAAVLTAALIDAFPCK